MAWLELGVEQKEKVLRCFLHWQHCIWHSQLWQRLIYDYGLEILTPTKLPGCGQLDDRNFLSSLQNRDGRQGQQKRKIDIIIPSVPSSSHLQRLKVESVMLKVESFSTFLHHVTLLLWRPGGGNLSVIEEEEGKCPSSSTGTVPSVWPITC